MNLSKLMDLISICSSIICVHISALLSPSIYQLFPLSFYVAAV